MNQFDIEKMLTERPFELLSVAEQEAVLEQMPGWEYDRLHQLLQRSKVALKRSPMPDPAIRERLLEALRQQPKPNALPKPHGGLLVRMAYYRLPVWQVAAGLAFLLAANIALQKAPKEVLRTETVYVNNTDTIYKEVALPVAEQKQNPAEKRVNVKPRLAKQLAPSSMDAIAVLDSASRQSKSLPDTMPGFHFTPQTATGRSANEMKELWQLLGDVY